MSEASVLQRPAGAARRRGVQRRLRLSTAPEATAVRRRRPRKGSEVDRQEPPPTFHPLAYRGVVAAWPLETRERWGRLANEREDRGLSWRDAEAMAFVEVWNELRRGRVG